MLAPLFLASILAACDGGGGPALQTVEPQTLRVNETLRVTVGIDNPDGRPVELRVEPPELPSFDPVTSITVDPGGATFRWQPLASQTGTHELTFVLTDPGGGTEYDRTSALFEVLASEDAAPVFVRPGAGGTYDLERDPCVTFDVEVRDDDSDAVDIGVNGELPERATLSNAGPKRATFDWCPTPDQAGSAERWTIHLYADDGEHPAVEHDYIVVLRTGPKEGCPGGDPVVTVTSPLTGERITSGTSYPVEATVTDDMGLRDPPLLYYSLSEPEDPTKPDVTTFEQVTFEPADGDRYVARIPPLGLEEGEDAEVWFLVSATDNDDPSGSLCDHRTDSELISFFAVGGTPPDGSLGVCEFCTSSTECESTICATTASGGRCAQACSDADCAMGVCGPTATTEGGVRAGCGPIREVCGSGGGECTDDSREDDDDPSSATFYSGPVSDGQICGGDSDYFGFDVAQGERLVVTVSDADIAVGDLDLSLEDMSGTIVETSAGVSDTEEVEYCNSGSAETFYARVFGYTDTDENSYSLTASVTPDPGMCCTDDAGEDDDTRSTARSVSFTPSGDSEEALFMGQVCPDDDDYVAIEMSGPGTIEALVTFSHADGDLDVDLYDPSGTRVGRADSATDDEMLTVDVAGGGTYALRIYGFLGSANDYEALVIRTEGAGCSTTMDCPLDTVCDAGSCDSNVCTSMSDCPAMHTCVGTGPVPAGQICAAECSVNADCRSSEACKWTADGRGCGRTGGGQNGESCATFADCGGQRSCHGFSGGYCARVGCSSTLSDCESNTACVSVDATSLCAVRCRSWMPDDCRAGYTCELLEAMDDDTPLRYVCVPE
ncbi:MAG TPA: hypothetical protein RMH99_18910 [Sandaracinaceae bacterium LLY-WYZ-13_1]|nr:hypothetical protein [Sandaracinaceae bacterium LLY-WYZ-13_1]